MMSRNILSEPQADSVSQWTSQYIWKPCSSKKAWSGDVDGDVNNLYSCCGQVLHCKIMCKTLLPQDWSKNVLGEDICSQAWLHVIILNWKWSPPPLNAVPAIPHVSAPTPDLDLVPAPSQVLALVTTLAPASAPDLDLVPAPSQVLALAPASDQT